MKLTDYLNKWLLMALLGVGLVFSTKGAVTDVILAPGAIQPGGNAGDTDLHWGQFWADTGTASQELDSTMHSSNNIAGSIHVIFDCQGAEGQDPANIKSANLAFGNYFLGGSGGWLGQPGTLTVDASKYESVALDINIASTVSSNTAIPFCLYGAGYGNVALTNFPIETGGWQRLIIPIPATVNLADCVSFGVYDWYNTTAGTPAAHVEFWMDNIVLVARKAVTPPPTLALAAMPHSGLLFDSGTGEGGARGAIDTIGDVHWAGLASAGSPVSYAMTIGWVPDTAVYSNYEAHIFIAPSPGVGNPDWNLADMGYLQILNHSDGTATARMMWKTNDAFDNKMLFNTSPGGDYGTNGYAAGTLGYLDAATMVGTWSLSFTSETDFVVRGPGGVSTNLSLPADWVTSFNALGGGVAYAYFGGGPNGNNNAGQPMFLSEVSISGANGQYALTNDFSSLPLDTTTWGLLGNETFIVPSRDAWWLNWTLPAANFNLRATSDLRDPNSWILLSGNTSLPVPVTPYTSGDRAKAIVAAADLPKANQTFFALQKLVAAKLQVLMPGETNAPGTTTGKIGKPDQQPVGTAVQVRVNAVDANWNVVPYLTDGVSLTSSDSAATDSMGAALPLSGQLAQGTATFEILFGTAGTQTVTATDTTQATVTANTGSTTTITP
jgi:hypothetical protein